MPRAVSLALAIVFLSAFLTPLQRELYVGDETKYAQVVREMRAGAFFLPTLNGTPFTHKPPLHFWLVDALTYPFGVYSIWPFVLPSLAAFALLLWLLRKMGGALAAFVCGTSLLIWGSAQTARMDVSFTALLVLGAWWMQRYFADGRARLLYLSGLAFGVATLVKGPMAPVIAIALFAFESFRRRRAPRAHALLALLLIALVPLLWFVPALIIGGEPFWREIFYKQTVGRAVGSWVHRSPPWFYLAHAPGDLVPWFLPLVAALLAVYRRRDDGAKFYVSWLLAVLVPYSLISSKLDVYMMALIPPVALLVARAVTYDETWTRRANVATVALFAVIGIAGLSVSPKQIKGPDAALASLLSVKLLFVVLAVAGFIGVYVALRRSLVASTIAVGLVPLAALIYAAIVLVPLANELASTRPLVRAIADQHVPPEEVTLHVAPYLWVRGMPRELERVKLAEGDAIEGEPLVIISRRKDTARIDVSRYRKVATLRMIGKDFDVYRR